MQAKEITGKPVVVDNDQAVGFYEREYYMLSNWSPHQILSDGILYPTLEHAYHSAKFEDKKLQEKIRKATSPLMAKEITWENKDKYRADWQEIMVDVMEKLCRLKIEQHKEVKNALIRSKGKELLEDAAVESFWGTGPDLKGKNVMGKIWMKLRNEILENS